MKKQRLLTQKQYAHRRGVSQQSINKAIQRGRIPTHGGRIDPSEADRALASEVSEANGTTLAAATIRWRLATAILRELEVDLQRGKLVAVDDVEAAQSQVNIAIKRKLLAMPSKLTPQLIGVASPAKIKTVLEREIRECLEELVKVAVPSADAQAAC